MTVLSGTRRAAADGRSALPASPAAAAPQLGAGRGGGAGGDGVRADLRGRMGAGREPQAGAGRRARTVAAGQLLTAADLQVVRVSASGPVSLVPAAAGSGRGWAARPPGHCRRAAC